MKIILLLTIIAGISFSGFCQTPSKPNDTSRLLVKKAELRQLIKSYKMYKELSDTLQVANDHLAQEAALKDTKYQTSRAQNSLLNSAIDAQKGQIKLKDDQFQLSEQRNKALVDKLNKQICRTWEVGGIGVVVSVTLLVLLVKK